MGLGRWWITHGPGSPGSVAKVMARSYTRIKNAYPAMAQSDLLFMTLRTRYSEYKLDETAVVRMIEESQGKLANLIVQVIHLEIPAATGAMINAPSVYLEMLDVVDEVVSRYAPST